MILLSESLLFNPSDFDFCLYTMKYLNNYKVVYI